MPRRAGAPRIADIVFRNTQERKWLDALLHPVANQARVALMEQASRDPKIEAFVWDSPLLLETRLAEHCDAVVFVDAPLADRLGRVAGRGWDAAELERRENIQMPLDKKRAKADYHLVNADAEPASAGFVARLRALSRGFQLDAMNRLLTQALNEPHRPA